MPTGRSPRSPRRASLAGAIALAVVVTALLAACTGQPSASGGNQSGGAATTGGNNAGGNNAGGTTTSGDPVSINITPAADSSVSPSTPIVVSASHGALRTVTVTNAATHVVVTGAFSADKSTWTSNEPLGFGASYQVVASGAGMTGTPAQQTATVNTISPSVTAYPSLLPAPNTSDVGVGQPIVVLFDHAVAQANRADVEKALRVTSNPPQTGGWNWVSAKEVHYRPENYWTPGTTINVNVNVYGVDFGNGVFGQTDRNETLHVHDSWIAQANGATEQMQIFHNGQLVKTMPISLGSPGHPSHVGVHVISDKQPSIVMDSCTYGVCKGQPGYYSETVYLDERISDDGEFVHSAPWSVGSQGSDNVSHGCVNLSPANAQWFFNTFGPGDVVNITNSGGPQLPLWDIYGDWELSWQQYQAGSALS
ncbi:MAG TPA: Ig-like domain-containing protein [Pseudonocardiaceae bacterium]|nr:Ig-like domain-containing protein [Pseudonocardiaceae bacterium]